VTCLLSSWSKGGWAKGYLYSGWNS